MLFSHLKTKVVTLFRFQNVTLKQYNTFSGQEQFQMFAANSIPEVDFIVTRNLKDFEDTGINVLPPDELINFL